EWGGELMLGDPAMFGIPASYGVFMNPAPPSADEGPSSLNAHLDNTQASKILMDMGPGSFVLLKPNRLVVLRCGLPHKINKVSPAAGSNVRASVGGFFRRTVKK